jgi:flagellar biosynthesis anti-sigma factor FlgM
MRIDPNVVVAPTTLDTTKSQQTPVTKAESEPAGSSVVTLSSAASAVAPEATSPPSVADRIDKIRSLLERGEYPVDLELLASRIVDDDFARSGRPS